MSIQEILNKIVISQYPIISHWMSFIFIVIRQKFLFRTDDWVWTEQTVKISTVKSFIKISCVT